MVVVTNLNRRLTSPQDKAYRENKPVAKFFTGPSKPRYNVNDPDPFRGKFNENIRSDQFYQEFPDTSAEAANADYNFRAKFGGNTFQDPSISQRVDVWMSKYDPYVQIPQNKYGQDTAGGRGLVEADRLITQDSMAPTGLVSSPAASGNGYSDPNVAGKFPSNSVAV